MTMHNLKLDRWTEILLDIDDNPNTIISGVQQRTRCMYAHVLDVIKLLKDQKLVTAKEEGRTTELLVTKTGQTVAYNLRSIKNIIGGKQNE